VEAFGRPKAVKTNKAGYEKLSAETNLKKGKKSTMTAVVQSNATRGGNPQSDPIANLFHLSQSH